MLCSAPTEQQAEFVAGEAAVTVCGSRVGKRDCEAIGVGVVRDDQLGVMFAGGAKREIEGARFFGVRERHCRKRAVGLILLGHRLHLGQRERCEHTLRGL